MRKFIQIIESGQTVYHGGPLSGEPHFPFFVSPDITVARSYAHDRGGQIFSFQFHPHSVAGEDDIRAAADALNIEHDETSTYVLISPNVDRDAVAIIEYLIEQGFDAAEFWDFAMDHDFKQVEAIVVFRSGALSAPALVES